MATSFLAGLLNATVAASTVLIFAALGEVIAERAGILNLLVGVILVGTVLGLVDIHVCDLTGRFPP